MEQYWMPKKLDFKNLRLCLDNYPVDRLFIREKYSTGGEVKVNEDLRGRKLDFKKKKTGLTILIDGKEVFCFPLKSYDKGFSLAFERITPTDDGVGRVVMLPTGVDPYDPNLPEPQVSFLRQILDGYLMEIFFKGRVHLKFHSLWIEPHWKYWVVKKPDKPQESTAKQGDECTGDS